MFNIALLAFLLISPVLFLPLSVPAIAALQWYQFGFFTNVIDVVQLQIFMYGIILLTITALTKIPERLFGDNYLKWFLLICVWSIYWHPISIKVFPQIFLGFLLYYLVSVCAEVRNLKPFFWSIFFVSLLNTIFAVLQFFGVHSLMFKEGQIVGLMGYKMQLGIYEALAIPICFSLNAWLSIIPIIGLLLSNSATAIIPAMAGMIYFLWKKGLRINAPYLWLLFFTSIGLFLYHHWYHLTLRFEAWIYAIKTSINHIFKGNGIGNFHYINTYNSLYPEPYSLYLGIFYSIGILGLIVCLLFIKDKLWNFKSDDLTQQALFSSCLILIISGLGCSFMDYPRLAGTAIILFGLLTAVRNREV